MDQFKKAKTGKNEWKDINDWTSENWPHGWSYRIMRAQKGPVKKVSVKIWELDSDNSDVYSASSVESDPD